MLAALLCCVLVLVPVVCSILYFGTSVARRLESNARGTASFYIDNLAERASATLDTLRGSIYYLMHLPVKKNGTIIPCHIRRTD